jgi:purine-binding chemotaxis protein CheW
MLYNQEEVTRILKQRAAVLARAPQAKPDARSSFSILEFELGCERYAIDPAYAREVCLLKTLTMVPCTPPFVLGVVNLRGRILSVIDILKFLGLAERGLAELNRIVVVHYMGLEVGLLADKINGFRSIAAADLQPPVLTQTGLRRDLLKGIVHDRVAVLDLPKLLSDQALIVHQEVL